jgi:uncharacterized protein
MKLDLFFYIQKIVDENRQIQFILTGSSNFLLMEKINQTLAGRTAILHLLPLSFEELEPGAGQYESVIFKGQYPRIYDHAIAPTDFYPSYIQTYIEKDVRLMKNIGDINAFIQFTQLCAGYRNQLAATPKGQGYVVYSGDQSLQTSAGSFVSKMLLQEIIKFI